SATCSVTWPGPSHCAAPTVAPSFVNSNRISFPPSRLTELSVDSCWSWCRWEVLAGEGFSRPGASRKTKDPSRLRRASGAATGRVCPAPRLGNKYEGENRGEARAVSWRPHVAAEDTHAHLGVNPVRRPRVAGC